MTPGSDDINTVSISGRVQRLESGQTDKGVPCGTLFLSSARGTGSDRTVSVTVKVNVYRQPLVSTCEGLKRGALIWVEGELMNRAGRSGDLLEVRARKIVICSSTEG